MSLEWLWPLLLFPLPLLATRFLPAASEQRAALYAPFLPALQSLPAGTSSPIQRARLRLFMAWLMWAALLLACCRPVLLGDAVEVATSGRDLLLAVDISGSMDERDMLLDRRAIRRIDMVKHVLAEFIARRRGDRIGLVLFGDHAYLQAPLTYDTGTVKQL
ncbi:MAG: VWA domain-containing protein, partial [Pseudomonadales bacterium]|nr:VWA domain-containing protein [Pseudomonadales bacterium]